MNTDTKMTDALQQGYCDEQWLVELLRNRAKSALFDKKTIRTNQACWACTKTAEVRKARAELNRLICFIIVGNFTSERGGERMTRKEQEPPRTEKRTKRLLRN